MKSFMVVTAVVSLILCVEWVMNAEGQNGVRFVHTSSSAPPVDVYNHNARMFTNVPYKNVTSYLSSDTIVMNVSLTVHGQFERFLCGLTFPLPPRSFDTVVFYSTEENFPQTPGTFHVEIDNHNQIPSDGEFCIKFHNFIVDQTNASYDVWLSSDPSAPLTIPLWKNISYTETTPYTCTDFSLTILTLTKAGQREIVLTTSYGWMDASLYSCIFAGSKQSSTSPPTAIIALDEAFGKTEKKRKNVSHQRKRGL